MKTFVTLSAYAALALSVGVPSAVFAQAEAQWPRFHGPEQNNISPDEDLLDRWPEGGPLLLWSNGSIGFGYATVSIADGRIYTAGNLDGKTMISALDLKGRLLWQVANGPAWTEPYGGTRGTPTIDGDRLYHESPLGEVVCLDARTGKRIWGLNILDRFGSKNIHWALAESLVIDGDRILCTPGGPQTAVVALDKQTGRTVWQSPSADGDLAGYATPRVIEQNGLRIVLQMTSKAMIGVDADRGRLLWRWPHETPFNENILTPVYHRGYVFLSTRSTGSILLKIDVEGQSAGVRPVWRSNELDNQHGGTLLLNGYLYGASYSANRQRWSCLDWRTGKLMWADRLVGRGALTCADGKLYVLSERHKVGLVAPGADEPRVISSFDLPPHGEGPSWAHPVVCGGRLYLRHGKWLYAHDLQRR